MRPFGGTDSTWFQGDFNPDDQKMLHRMFAEHPVRAVFAAHDHFHHEEQHDGIRYMTVAGAGSPMYAPPTRGGYAHYVLIRVGPDGVDYTVVEPGRLDVDVVAGGDGIEPLTIARVANTTDRDLLVRNLALRVPRLAAREDYAISIDYLDWERKRQHVPVTVQSLVDSGDGSAELSLGFCVPTGVAFRVTVEARFLTARCSSSTPTTSGAHRPSAAGSPARTPRGS